MEKDIKEYINLPIVLILALLIVSLFVLVPVLDMIVLGAILAFLLRPLFKKIDNKLNRSTVSIFISIAIILVPLILLLVYMLQVTFGIATDIFLSNSVISFNKDQITQLVVQYIPMAKPYVAGTVDNILTTVAEEVLAYIVNLIKNSAYILIEILILLASTFYFLRDGEQCFNFVKSFIPSQNIEFFDKTVENIKEVLKSIFYGHFLTAIIIGVAGAIGYALLGYSYSGFLGIVTGIFQLIPVIGPWPVYWFLFFIDLFNGNYLRMIIVLLFGFVLSVSDVYIRPALTSHYVDVHPFIFLVGFLAGPLVFGIVGLIIGPFVLGMTYAILKTYKEEH